MAIKPLYDRILLKRIEQENKSAGGLIIPDTAQEKPMKGTVVATGEGSYDDQGKLRPLKVKKGDTVIFAKWGGTEIKIDGEEYLIVKESDVLAIVE